MNKATITERIHGNLAYLVERSDEEIPTQLEIPRHPLIRTTQLAGGVIVRQEAMTHYHLSIYHSMNPRDQTIKPRHAVVQSHIELPESGIARITVHPGNVEAEKYEEHLAYAMTSYLPKNIVIQALRKQPKKFTVKRPVDKLEELLDFVDFTSGYRG